MGDGGGWGEKWEGRRGNCPLGVRTNKYKEEQQQEGEEKEGEAAAALGSNPDPSLLSRQSLTGLCRFPAS